MGQIEVYEWLRAQRKRNSFYFTVGEVSEALKSSGYSNGVLHGIRGDLLRLEFAGYLDVKLGGTLDNWARRWRLKLKYV